MCTTLVPWLLCHYYSSIEPPAASIAALAPLVTPKPLTLTAFSILPAKITFADKISLVITLAAFNASKVTTSPSTFAKSFKRFQQRGMILMK